MNAARLNSAGCRSDNTTHSFSQWEWPGDLGPCSILDRKRRHQRVEVSRKPAQGTSRRSRLARNGRRGFQGFSASHTINGHSIVFRLRYGGFSFLFSVTSTTKPAAFWRGSMITMRLISARRSSRCRNHGSADFLGGFLEKVSPIISVVSSGDESARKEYIHPRATLMGAWGNTPASMNP